MKPPICCICGKNFLDNLAKGGKLVYFKKSKEGKEFEEKVKEGFVGHHPDTEWFCKEHLKSAEKYNSLELSEALKLISSPTKKKRLL